MCPKIMHEKVEKKTKLNLGLSRVCFIPIFGSDNNLVKNELLCCNKNIYVGAQMNEENAKSKTIFF